MGTCVPCTPGTGFGPSRGVKGGIMYATPKWIIFRLRAGTPPCTGTRAFLYPPAQNARNRNICRPEAEQNDLRMISPKFGTLAPVPALDLQTLPTPGGHPARYRNSAPVKEVGIKHPRANYEILHMRNRCPDPSGLPRLRDAISRLIDAAVDRASRLARVALRSSPAFQPIRPALRTRAFAFELALQT